MPAPPLTPGPDASSGWDAAADVLIGHRAQSTIGVEVLRAWARELPAGASVLDLGCGAGAPVSTTLAALGHRVAGIDASLRLIAAYRARFPQAEVACEPAESSALFGRTFDAVVSVGMMFVLDEAAQRAVIRRVGRALAPGGRFLFTAPWQTATWIDPTTGYQMRSLGRDEYATALQDSGLRVVATPIDDGGNHYVSTLKA